MDEIPDVVWREARKQARIAGYSSEVDMITFATGWVGGRASIHAEWARQLAESGPDETGDIRTIAEALARQRVEATVRAEVAAEIRAVFVAGAKVPPWALRNGMPVASSIAEWAARIAEGPSVTETARQIVKDITKEETND